MHRTVLRGEPVAIALQRSTECSRSLNFLPRGWQDDSSWPCVLNKHTPHTTNTLYNTPSNPHSQSYLYPNYLFLASNLAGGLLQLHTCRSTFTNYYVLPIHLFWLCWMVSTVAYLQADIHNMIYICYILLIVYLLPVCSDHTGRFLLAYERYILIGTSTG